jgi:Flp pilus assembly protein TadG
MLRPHQPARRRAVAAVELAVVLPFLVFLFLVAVDYCRVFYYSQVITTCARNGALYVSDPQSPVQSPYSSLSAAATADADPSYASQITVTSSTGSDTNGNYTIVTVTYPFTTLIQYPGIPQSTTLTRTAKVRPAPATPN